MTSQRLARQAALAERALGGSLQEKYGIMVRIIPNSPVRGAYRNIAGEGRDGVHVVRRDSENRGNTKRKQAQTSEGVTRGGRVDNFDSTL